jgi:hypothetical protein
MASSFTPLNEPTLYCRFCKKVIPFQLERSIAGSGRTVDRASTFEYVCTKCHKTTCFSGQDLIAAEKVDGEEEPRGYTADEHFLIGEVISHDSFQDTGTVVGKDPGSPSRIMVQFEKAGFKKLVEGI